MLLEEFEYWVKKYTNKETLLISNETANSLCVVVKDRVSHYEFWYYKITNNFSCEKYSDSTNANFMNSENITDIFETFIRKEKIKSYVQ